MAVQNRAQGAEPRTAAAVAPPDPTWERLEEQIAYYDGKSGNGQRWYKRIKLVQLVTAAAIPVAALVDASSWVPGVLGSAVVVLEGCQQLYQHQEHWITYRSTCEALRHERYLYLALAGPYASAVNPKALLAERIEGLVSQEHAQWASSQEELPRRPEASAGAATGS
jgi:hypothetical protein